MGMVPQMVEYFLIGTLLGLPAGLSPGPLLTLVIAETLRQGTAAGVRVALSPLVTDLPIILVAWWVLAELSRFQGVLGFISLLGAFFVAYLGYECLLARELSLAASGAIPNSLAKGILANLFNPHPYLFWLTIGGATMHKALSIGTAALLGFLGAFYLWLVGGKVVLAMVVGRARGRLSGRAYPYLMRFLGVVLCGLALVLLREGLGLLALRGV